MTYPLSVILGSLVGLSTGVSGAGGSLLAIPLLVYGLAVSPRDAFPLSLASTAVACLVGLVPRIRAGQVEFRPGLLFAGAGVISAPVGTWFADQLPTEAILLMLSVLMIGVAFKMLRRSAAGSSGDATHLWTTRTTTTITLVGLGTGFLSGTLGVGCGFIVVPALSLLAGVRMHRAIGTALLAMGVISTSGAASYFFSGRGLSNPPLACMFVTGAAIGVLAGGTLASRLSDKTLRRVFSGVIVVAALLLVVRSLSPLLSGKKAAGRQRSAGSQIGEPCAVRPRTRSRPTLCHKPDCRHETTSAPTVGQRPPLAVVGNHGHFIPPVSSTHRC